VILIKKDKNQNNLIRVNKKFDMKQNRLSLNIPWTFDEDIILNLRDKILSQGKLIKNIDDILIYRGILTGCNDAFIINEQQKNYLVSLDKKNEKILKPVIRGRDISKWFIDYKNLYMVVTRNGIDVKKEYPTIYKYLVDKDAELKELNKNKNNYKGIQNRSDQGDHWTNLRNCNFYDQFEKPKIVYSEIVQSPQFSYDDRQFYPEATTFSLSTEKYDIKLLLALLNSNVLFWVFRFLCTTLSDNGIRYKKKFIQELPLILNMDSKKEKEICEHVNKIIKYTYNKNLEENKLMIEKEESKLNKLIYELYNINTDEKEIIEKDINFQ